MQFIFKKYIYLTRDATVSVKCLFYLCILGDFLDVTIVNDDEKEEYP